MNVLPGGVLATMLAQSSVGDSLTVCGGPGGEGPGPGDGPGFGGFGGFGGGGDILPPTTEPFLERVPASQLNRLQ